MTKTVPTDSFRHSFICTLHADVQKYIIKHLEKKNKPKVELIVVNT